ncbi:MAG: peroxiredoxin [Gammaproteobacteria bacterium]|nr:peroxiredoxin [Gammaproteobacteria bacterium]
MKNLMAVATLALSAAVLADEAPTASLEAGMQAPDWTLPGSDGETHALADLLKKGPVVLAWFPKAFTPGCTAQCQSLAQNGDMIREYKVSYFMASVDPIGDNTDFASKYDADFPILSDESKEVANAYQVIGQYGVPRRETFYIGTDGVILAVDREVDARGAAEETAAMLASLGVEKRASPASSAGR